MASGESPEGARAEFVDVAGDYAAVPVPQSQRRTLLNLLFVYADVVAVVAAIASADSMPTCRRGFSPTDILVSASSTP